MSYKQAGCFSGAQENTGIAHDYLQRDTALELAGFLTETKCKFYQHSQETAGKKLSQPCQCMFITQIQTLVPRRVQSKIPTGLGKNFTHTTFRTQSSE